MDHVHHPREAGQGLRSLHPGRVRPLQGHDQHRLQLSPARADRRQLGRGEFWLFLLYCDVVKILFLSILTIMSLVLQCYILQK
jgi:hypothetical protein